MKVQSPVTLVSSNLRDKNIAPVTKPGNQSEEKI